MLLYEQPDNLANAAGRSLYQALIKSLRRGCRAGLGERAPGGHQNCSSSRGPLQGRVPYVSLNCAAPAGSPELVLTTPRSPRPSPRASPCAGQGLLLHLAGSWEAAGRAEEVRAELLLLCPALSAVKI